MPNRAKKPCGQPACPALTDGRYCAEHARTEQRRYDRERGSAAKRGYGAPWPKLRKIVLARDPICRDCGRAASTEADHITPRREGGSDSLDNLQGLCKPCHSRKTAIEDGRWAPRPIT
jgi:5-methylcytosine-specific restriction protein A